MKAGHGERLTRRRHAALLALLSEPTLQAVAEKVGISRRRLQVWMAEPAFQAELRALRGRVVDQCVARLTSMLLDFTAVLHQVATDQNASASARVSAAREGWAIVMKMREFEEVAELTQKLAELEARLEAQDL